MSLLEADNVSVYYGDFCALAGVSLHVNEREFISIVGPNGAGKTTLVNVLTGLVAPTDGHVRFLGNDIAGRGAVRLSKLGMSRSFQLVNVFSELTVWETIAVAIVSRTGRGRRWFGTYKADREIGREVERIADLFGLTAHLYERSGTLPQGDKKLLDVASAFALRPIVILLDEPTSGVSTSQKHDLMRLMVNASEETGVKSLIQIEHDMDLVFEYSSRIIAIHQGCILADTTPDKLRADAHVMSSVVGKAPA